MKYAFALPKVFIFIAIFFNLIACSSTTSNPDFAITVVGNYQVQYLNLAGTEITPEFLMLIGGSANINLERKETNKVIFNLKTVIRGTTTEIRKEFTLSDAGSGVINVLENGVRIGTHSNNKIDINTQYESGSLLLTANK
jgi:hypothetical protein